MPPIDGMLRGKVELYMFGCVNAIRQTEPSKMTTCLQGIAGVLQCHVTAHAILPDQLRPQMTRRLFCGSYVYWRLERPVTPLAPFRKCLATDWAATPQHLAAADRAQTCRPVEGCIWIIQDTLVVAPLPLMCTALPRLGIRPLHLSCLIVDFTSGQRCKRLACWCFCRLFYLHHHFGSPGCAGSQTPKADVLAAPERLLLGPTGPPTVTASIAVEGMATSLDLPATPSLLLQRPQRLPHGIAIIAVEGWCGRAGGASCWTEQAFVTAAPLNLLSI
mmetsp:Transcript_16258/g.38147  ORF Transcript_16258/g.38147 Transcript_16258/m.38147 type:complete len:275 (-) Transcript_16258:258-1082(-)